MTAAKIIGTSYTSMGAGGTRKDNSLVTINGVILTTSDFSFATVAEMADKDNWTDGIKAKKVFPFFGLDSYEDQSTEAIIYESQLKRRKITDMGRKRFTFFFDQPMDQHRAMQTFRNGDLRVYLVQSDGAVRFYNDGGVVKGFTTSLVNPAKMSEVPGDGSKPALSPFLIDLENYREWDENGDLFTPSWEAADLEPLVPVSITQKTASADSLKIFIGSVDGYESTGLTKYVPIKGITPADILVYQSDGTTLVTTGTVAETSPSDGTYTIPKASTSFATGMLVKLKSAETMATTGLLPDLIEALSITVS